MGWVQGGWEGRGSQVVIIPCRESDTNCPDALTFKYILCISLHFENAISVVTGGSHQGKNDLYSHCEY